MKEPRIRDASMFKRMLEHSESVGCIISIMPLLRPVVRLLGADVDRMDELLLSAKNLIHATKEFAAMPDRFNDLFASRGWIMYESMKYEVAKGVVEKAELGDIEGAEQELVNYYDAATVELHLRRMTAVQVFRPRMRLALKALMDYREDRYHACVPVVLALLDGLANELHEPKKQGFFAKGARLEAWDSIAAHSTGLEA